MSTRVRRRCAFVEKQKLCGRWAGDCCTCQHVIHLLLQHSVTCTLATLRRLCRTVPCVRNLIPLSGIFTDQGAICHITEFRGDKPVRVGGFFGSLWNRLQARLNFT